MAGPRSYFEVLTEAVNDLVENGFDSVERLARWERLLEEAARQTMGSAAERERQVREAMMQVYRRLVDDGRALTFHPGVQRFTLEQLRPALRGELDRRILASANLIRLNRDKSIATTLSRFSGWATSIPAGGSRTTNKREEKAHIRKALASLPFEERRVAIDQGHKLAASINDIIAVDGGAIAGMWRSRWREPGYNYREPHKERDGVVYAIRGSWAMEAGLITKGAGYTDEITQPAEEPYCRCSYRYLYALRDLPSDMLTRKGVAEMERVRQLVRGTASAA